MVQLQLETTQDLGHKYNIVCNVIKRPRPQPTDEEILKRTDQYGKRYAFKRRQEWWFDKEPKSIRFVFTIESR
jgi:hypothetical protein